MPTLDLLSEPWILVRDGQGGLDELGLRDVLLRAHDLREIRDPLPIVEFGLYRLLIALVMDIYAFQDLRSLEELLEVGRFEPDRVDRYIIENKERFDLFHPEKPFLQMAEMRDEADKPLCGLLPPVPSGTNANHFYHALEKEFGVCPSAAARLLTTLAPFMTAGGAGLAPSINGAPPWYALVTGSSLFQTLCLNACVLHLPQGNDGKPAWKQTAPWLSERRKSASLLEGLTWQPRRVLLTSGGSGCCALTGRTTDTLVCSMKFGPGASVDFAWTDPNAAYRVDAAKGQLILRPQEGKQVWRDVGPIALMHHQSHGGGENRVQFQRPRVVDQYATLYSQSRSLVPPSLHLVLYGMRTDMKMKIFEWQRETLEALPAPLVLNELFGKAAQAEMERAGKVDSGLARALKLAYPRDGKGNKKAFDSRIGYTRRAFWSALRSGYMALLADLSKADPLKLEEEAKPLLGRWKQQLRKVGWQVLDNAIADLDTGSQQILRTEVLVRNEFQKALYFTIEEGETRPKKEKKRVSKQSAAAGAEGE